jgi:hypothetical protein
MEEHIKWLVFVPPLFVAYCMAHCIVHCCRNTCEQHTSHCSEPLLSVTDSTDTERTVSFETDTKPASEENLSAHSWLAALKATRVLPRWQSR